MTTIRSGRHWPSELTTFYETAFKAIIQSASLVDLATADGGADAVPAEAGRELWFILKNLETACHAGMHVIQCFASPL